MILGLVFIACLLSVPLARGRLSALGDLKLKRGWLALAGIGVQILIISVWPGAPEALSEAGTWSPRSSERGNASHRYWTTVESRTESSASPTDGSVAALIRPPPSMRWPGVWLALLGRWIRYSDEPVFSLVESATKPYECGRRSV